MAKEKRKIRQSLLSPPLSGLSGIAFSNRKKGIKSSSQPEKDVIAPPPLIAYSANLKRALLLLFFFFVVWFFGIRYADFLYVSQFSDLFCFDTVRLLERFSGLGGGLYALTSFMVQFFYHPLFGGIGLALFSVSIAWATAKFYSLEGHLYLLSFVPPLTLMIAIVSLNYLIFDLLAIHKIYAVFPGILIALLMGVSYLHIRSLKQRLFLLFGSLLLLFPLCGFYALLGGLFCMMGECQHNVQAKKNIPSDNSSNQSNHGRNLKFILEIIFLFILGIPILWYPLFCHHLKFTAIYYEGIIPSALLLEDYVKAMMTYWLLLGALAVFFILLAFRKIRTGHRYIPHNKFPTRGLASQEWYGLLFFLLMIGGTTLIAHHADSFMRTLKIYRALEDGDWDKILTNKVTDKTNDRATIATGNLALFEKGEMGERIFETDQAGVIVPALVQVSTYRVFGERLLYRAGLINFSERITMNKFVSRPESALVHRMFVRIAAVNDNVALAERFMPALECSLFHADWVQPWRNWFRYREGLSESDLLRKYPDFSLAGVSQVDEEVNRIRSRRPVENYFTEVILPEFSILEISQHEGFEQMTPEMQELYLTSALLLRAKPIFMKHIDHYIETRSDRPLQKHFREALQMFRSQAKGDVGGDYWKYYIDDPHLYY